MCNQNDAIYICWNTVMINYSKGTTESQMFIKAELTVTVLSRAVGPFPFAMTKPIGCVALKIAYFFLMFPITLSTCILTFAIRLVCSTSMPFSCFLPFVKVGTLFVTQHSPTESWVSKPRSTRMASPGISLSRRPLFSVICLSLTIPPNHLRWNSLFLGK